MRKYGGWNGYASFGNSYRLKTMLEQMVEAELKLKKPPKALTLLPYCGCHKKISKNYLILNAREIKL